MTDTPLRTHSRKNFLIGWIAIVAVGAIAFTLASLPMRHSHETARLADNAYVTQAETPRS